MADLAHTIGLTPVKPPTGAWFVYSTDYGYHPLALFSDELSARQWADEHDYGSVVFWPFGMDWKEARHG